MDIVRKDSDNLINCGPMEKIKWNELHQRYINQGLTIQYNVHVYITIEDMHNAIFKATMVVQ